MERSLANGVAWTFFILILLLIMSVVISPLRLSPNGLPVPVPVDVVDNANHGGNSSGYSQPSFPF
jgi:hypothetical protein